MSFKGFSEEFVDFFSSLEFNNTTDSLQENKAKYEKLITAPLTLLFDDLVPAVSSVSDSLITIRSKCVSSMYSDKRYNRGKPLRNYMYLKFREQFYDEDIIALYFDMGIENYSYGIRIYKQTGAGMDKIRDGALALRHSFTVELERMKKHGMSIVGDPFAKDKYPRVSNLTLKELVNMKKFYIAREQPISNIVFSSELSSEVYDAFIKMKGMYTLLKEALYDY